jgi:hypothetical protein
MTPFQQCARIFLIDFDRGRMLAYALYAFAQLPTHEASVQLVWRRLTFAADYAAH